LFSAHRLAVIVGMLIAAIMFGGSVAYISYIYGYSIGQQAGFNEAYNQGQVKGYTAGFKEGYNSIALEQNTKKIHHNPTYQEMKQFLVQDRTDSKKYVKDLFNCTDFTAEVVNNAEVRGIRCGMVDLFFPEGYGHTIVAFETTDKGLVFVEPQFDMEVQLIVGKSYSLTNEFSSPGNDDTIKRYLIVW
jgi:hypothetical protein